MGWDTDETDAMTYISTLFSRAKEKHRKNKKKEAMNKYKYLCTCNITEIKKNNTLGKGHMWHERGTCKGWLQGVRGQGEQ